ncbi:MAG: phosphate ABC transporter permease subunit PstC [Chloroflexota bacterium]
MAGEIMVESPTTQIELAEDVAVGLRKKRKWHESLIQGFLLLCGVLSIFTTIGIVIILLNESIGFFTREVFEITNRSIATEIGPDATTFQTTDSGSVLVPEQIVRVDDELMRVISVDGLTVTVERGFRDTIPVAHGEDQEIEKSVNVTVGEVFSGSRWQPRLQQFGMWPLILSTLMISFIAMLVSLPLGLASALYLSEYASQRARSILKPILEVLAGIPTVVYGYFALTFMTPFLGNFFGDGLQVFNTLSAGIVVGVLIIPLVSSMSEDALHAVPDSLRQASYGLGATKLETALRVVLPAALSGVTAAFVVAISRAIGETMIVAVAAGAGPRNFDWVNVLNDISKTPFNPLQSAETMTGHIVRISGGDLSYNSIDYNSIFAIGLVLFSITLLLNISSRRIVERFREVYD